VDTSEGTEIRPEHRARAFATVAVDFTSTLPIIIPGPFAGTVAHGGMGGVAAMITLPLVGVERCATSGDVVSHQMAAGLSVRMVADPPALLARVARDHTDDGWARSFAYVPCPLCLFARRWGGSVGQGEAYCFSPALWYRSSASTAVPHITAVGAVSFRWP
jgi:hypothetical protein